MRLILVDENGIVIGIRNGSTIGDGEIASEIGELGQIMQDDGSFIDIPIDTSPMPTLEEQIQLLQDQNLIFMDALADIYEVLIAKDVV